MFTKLLLLCLSLVVPSLGASLPYIIGGTEVDSAIKYPHQCSLQYFTGTHLCGASLISSTWLVTAAHCVGVYGYAVMCGTVNRLNGTIGLVIQVIRHEDYGVGDGLYPNDIAVIKVYPAFNLSDTIKPISMWDSATDPAGNEDCHISGWGLTQVGGGGALPKNLWEAKINVYTPAECKKVLNTKINDGHVCIGDVHNGRGSCNGDSGGPLVCKDGGEYKLVGATSWGRRGCSTSYPSVYSRISYFRSWITDKTGVQ